MIPSLCYWSSHLPFSCFFEGCNTCCHASVVFFSARVARIVWWKLGYEGLDAFFGGDNQDRNVKRDARHSLSG